MIQAKCIQKFRDKNGKIVAYKLQDLQGNVLDVRAKALKEAISNMQIEIVNLTLTSDGRLVDKQERLAENSSKVINVNKSAPRFRILKISSDGKLVIEKCPEFNNSREISNNELVKLMTEGKVYIDNCIINDTGIIEFCDNIEVDREYIGKILKEVIQHPLAIGYKQEDIDLKIDNVAGSHLKIEVCTKDKKIAIRFNELLNKSRQTDYGTLPGGVSYEGREYHKYTIYSPLCDICPEWNSEPSKLKKGFIEIADKVKNYIILKEALAADKYLKGSNKSKTGTKDIKMWTITDLSSEIHLYIKFECGDMGGNEFDQAYANNRFCFATINRIRQECIDRGYLTDEEFEQWMVGYDSANNIYYHNEYTLDKWIHLHRK